MGLIKPSEPVATRHVNLLRGPSMPLFPEEEYSLHGICLPSTHLRVGIWLNHLNTPPSQVSHIGWCSRNVPYIRKGFGNLRPGYKARYRVRFSRTRADRSGLISQSGQLGFGSDCWFNHIDLSPKFPPALRGVLGVKSLALGGHLVHGHSL